MSQDVLNAIINLIIQVSTIAALGIVIYLVAWKPLMAMLDKRAETISKDVEDAEISNQEAQKLKVEARDKLQEIQSSASSVINDAKQMADKMQTDAEMQLQETLKKRQADFDEQLRVEKQRAKEEVAAQVVELSMAVAKTYLQDNVDQKDTEARMSELTKKLVSSNE